MGSWGSKPTPPPTQPVSLSLTPPAPKPPSSMGSWMTGSVKTILILLAGAVTLLVGILIYNAIRKSRGLSTVSLTGDSSTSGDQLPAPVSGKAKTVIPAANAPIGANGTFGMQFWMFISDWDFNFSKEKTVIKRIGTGTSTDVSPWITLHPTDNSLQVKIAIYPSSTGTGTASSTGDSFTCTVENVPLQRWFSVSVTVFQRNVDIYIDGRLVKSCVLPGVPKPVLGDIHIGDDANGFSGSVCTLKSYSKMLGPTDAKAYAAAGTMCQAPTPVTTSSPADSSVASLFGYTFRFSTLDKAGKELSTYTL
jgi:hypothetical protein